MENQPVKRKHKSFKEKSYDRVREYIANPTDIKFEGPLSYRYLRVLAWIFFAISQLAFVIRISSNFFDWQIVSEIGASALKSLGNMATPLFIIASFGLILSRQRTYKHFLLIYGSIFVGIATIFDVVYLRYVFAFYTFKDDARGLEQISNAIKGFANVNIFADLFMLSLFCFFIEYDPKKIFKKKKVIYFRLMAILPALYVAASYTLKTLHSFDAADIPLYLFPFMTTKSPLIFLTFIMLALWIKYRERLFVKAGATKQDYKNYLKTNKNSFAYSIHLSVFIMIIASIELTLMIVISLSLVARDIYTVEQSFVIVDQLGIGQATPMILAIPFIMLYSYKKSHKNGTIDLLLPIIGIVLTAFVYAEWIFGLLTRS